MLLLAPASAHADKVGDLSRALVSGKTEKARISAAVSLARLKDARALKPFIRALSDESNVVRALAATALGFLGDPAALPALERAARDRDMTVRRRAQDALARLRRDDAGAPVAARTLAPTPARGGGMANYAIAPREERPGQQVFVVLKSTQDKSLGNTPSKVRQLRAIQMRSLMLDHLKRDQTVTLMSSVAAELGIDPYAMDVTIMKLERFERGPFVEVECEIRVAISDRRGKMLSFLTGGAKVQVPRSTFRLQYETQLKREALENAVKSVHGDVVKYLRNRPS
ncbi:MAG TPA: HEAT repeat domain-containing protein [Kofleriaceae bacterium]|nr:HEAT repeat domain-containing protein [Kofleriaceae bacterium]